MADRAEPVIVIVGGVAGGASAAARARRCHETAHIILFEKDHHVSFANCGLPYYIGGEITDREKLIVASPELFRKRFRIDVRIRSEVQAIDRQAKTVTVHERDTGRSYTQPYDKLILSPGATPVQPSIPGMDAVNVFTLRNLHDTDRIRGWLDRDSVRKAVVVGAGFIGLEMVEMLRHRRLDVELVELSPQVLPPLDVEMAHIVQHELEAQGVKLHLGKGMESLVVERGQVRRVALSDGSELEADVVIVAIGVRPNVKLAQEAGLAIGKTGGILVNDTLQTNDPDIYAVGDAAEYHHAVADMNMRVPLAGPANRAGRLAGEHAVMGRSAAMGSVLGTAIVRVFDVVAAVTGCNMRCVNASHEGVKPLAIYVRHSHHASYYPGAETMTIKLLIDPASEKLLGAQIVGGEGVDKRIDILATLILTGGSVRTLTDLDLAYAPPFGAAKDPVHMAGFAACNALDGLVRFLPPDTSLDGWQVIDVRSKAEIEALPLPGAIHIPLDDLRDRLDELDPQLPTVVVCASGQRSYIGARVLMQHGFEHVADLSGGMQMRRHAWQDTKSAAAAVGTR